MEVDTPEILPETIEPVPFPACLGDYEDREEDEARQVSLDFREEFLVDEEDDGKFRRNNSINDLVNLPI